MAIRQMLIPMKMVIQELTLETHFGEDDEASPGSQFVIHCESSSKRETSWRPTVDTRCDD